MSKEEQSRGPGGDAGPRPEVISIQFSLKKKYLPTGEYKLYVNTKKNASKEYCIILFVQVEFKI